MRLKIFQAPNIGAAMALVRDELGPDALILANRDVDGGVELTAAQETPHEAPQPRLVVPISAERAPIPLTNAPAEIARAGTLKWHGVPADLALSLGRGDLVEALRTTLRFGSLPRDHGDAPVLLVGPPGAGKTLTAARLATRLKLSGQPSMMITADGRRAGAAEQLAAFTRLLGLTLIVADTAKQLARAVARRENGQPVIVDMPGLNPFDPQDQTFIRECQSAIGASVALVIPAGLDPGDAQDMSLAFTQLGAEMLIITRLDQSRRLGGVLAAAGTGLTLTDAGIGPGVADGLAAMTAELLAERLAFASPPASIPPLVPPSTSPFSFLARARSEQPRHS